MLFFLKIKKATLNKIHINSYNWINKRKTKFTDIKMEIQKIVKFRHKTLITMTRIQQLLKV